MNTLGILFMASLIFLPIFALAQTHTDVPLPKPSFTGRRSVEEAIKARRTIRHFKAKALNLEQLSQILWAAYGITANGLYKSVPSAGALYPLDIWVAAGKNGVEGLEAGVYHYIPKAHRLTQVKAGEVRDDIAKASLYQNWMAEAPVIFIITGEYERCTRKYGEKGISYTYIEAGHAGQNIFLQAGVLGLGAGIVGAFNNDVIRQALGISRNYDPILIMPVGYK
ncbi:MAG: SagB/ThcOx family dehydrogenase [Desulfovibrionales bacterium]|nr:SagB/ThcOx family dehydrogenase [Desulfovibrionales bacterium]